MARRLEDQRGLGVRNVPVPDDPDCAYRDSQATLDYTRGKKRLRPFFNRHQIPKDRTECRVSGCSWKTTGVCKLMSERNAESRANLSGDGDETLDASLE